MVTEKEKEYYNTYLAVSRSCRNKPFTPRKNFEGFETTPEYIYINKISYFLSKFPQIKSSIFFKAPYELYPDVDIIDLKFYTTQKAIKAYTTYLNQLQEQSPDSEHNIEFIKESLRFIGMFCIKNKIPIEQYITHSGGSTYSWMKHVREHNVSIYSLFDFSNIFDIIHSTSKDEIDLLLSSIITHISGYKNKYDTSREARKLVEEGMKRIKLVVDKTLQTRKESVIKKTNND